DARDRFRASFFGILQPATGHLRSSGRVPVGRASVTYRIPHTMKSLPLTREQMNLRTVRFADMKPYQQQHQDARGIPAGALQRLAAHRVYPVVVPANYKGRGEQAPFKGAPGLIISLTESPPGDGAALHIHEQ